MYRGKYDHACWRLFIQRLKGQKSCRKFLHVLSGRLQGLDTDRDHGPIRSHVDPEHGAKDAIFIRKVSFVLSNLVSTMKCSVCIVGLTPPAK